MTDMYMKKDDCQMHTIKYPMQKVAELPTVLEVVSFLHHKHTASIADQLTE